LPNNPNNMLRPCKKYLLLAVILFVIEILIGVYAHDKFIRPFGGDFLVVILIYCFIKGFFNLPVIKTAIGVLAFAYIVETLQYFKITVRLGLQQSKLANIIIGNSFSWTDIICYTLGIALVIVIEKLSGNIMSGNV